MLINLVCTFKR